MGERLVIAALTVIYVATWAACRDIEAVLLASYCVQLASTAALGVLFVAWRLRR